MTALRQVLLCEPWEQEEVPSPGSSIFGEHEARSVSRYSCLWRRGSSQDPRPPGNKMIAWKFDMPNASEVCCPGRDGDLGAGTHSLSVYTDVPA